MGVWPEKLYLFVPQLTLLCFFFLTVSSSLWLPFITLTRSLLVFMLQQLTLHHKCQLRQRKIAKIQLVTDSFIIIVNINNTNALSINQ